MTEIQKDVTFGLLLGDAWLQTQSKGKTYRFRYEQGECHRDYFHHIVEIYSPWLSHQPTQYTRINAAGNTVITWRLQTRTDPVFSYFGNILYTGTPFRKKTLFASFIEEYLTPRGLAYWFMDDGGKSFYGQGTRYGLTFNTHGFSVQEVDWLVEGLRKKFGFTCWMKMNKGLPIVVISGYSYKDFLALCGMYIHPSMYHKLPCGGFKLMT